jgi:ubiquinone/menaquinone biosynthesis C-methylase UbiE
MRLAEAIERSVKKFDNAMLTVIGGASSRERFYERLYALDWGDITTNNYGYAPAADTGRERFQLQLYAELFGLLQASAALPPALRLVEISCGRGGGLKHLASRLPAGSLALGIDFSANALDFCRKNHCDLCFLRAHALQLPFADASVDIVLNVEASHAYGNDRAFFAEVARILRPGGRMLFADYRLRRKLPRLQKQMRAVGLQGEWHDITANVVQSCELDAARRRQAIKRSTPWYYRLLLAGNFKRYAGLPNSVTFRRFQSGERLYFMTCLSKT